MNLPGNFGFSQLKQREPLSIRVAALLQEAILNGKMSPGTRLVEENIAAEMGISRMPVREAIRSLEKFGLVVVEPGQGARVASPTIKDIEDLYGLRITLELYAIELCIQDHRSESTQELQAQIDDTREVYSKEPDLDRYKRMDIDIRFDDILCKACGNQKLYEVWQALSTNIRMLFTINPFYTGHDGDPTVPHQSIVDAIRDGDLNGARQLLKEHLQASMQFTLSSLRDAKGKEA